MEIDLTVFNHSAKSRGNRQRLDVLIVEDDEFSRELLKKSLKEFEPSVAETGESAIKAYTLTAPDIVFLDIELPDISGIDVLAKIVKADSNSFIVMLTSHTEKEVVEKAIMAGAKGYIAKPFSKEKLLLYAQKCAALKQRKK